MANVQLLYNYTDYNIRKNIISNEEKLLYKNKMYERHILYMIDSMNLHYLQKVIVLYL